jgi:ATP-dependent RNA helicase DeaD
MPLESETYVHRIGRTGRAGKEGVAITFVTPDERYRIPIIEYDVGTKILEMEAPLGRVERNVRPVEKVVETEKRSRDDRSDYRAVKEVRPDHERDKPATRKSKGPVKEKVIIDRARFVVKDTSPEMAASDKVSIEINLGRLDGVSKATIFDFIKHSTKLPDGAIGRIGLGEAKSQVEIHKNNVDVALDNIACKSFKGKSVKAHKVSE